MSQHAKIPPRGQVTTETYVEAIPHGANVVVQVGGLSFRDLTEPERQAYGLVMSWYAIGERLADDCGWDLQELLDETPRCLDAEDSE